MTYEGTFLLYFCVFTASVNFIDQGMKSNLVRRRKAFVFMGLMLPIVMAAIRYWVGTDWGMYRDQFYRSQTGSWSEVLQDGYFGCFIFIIRKLTAYTGVHQIYFGILAGAALIPIFFAVQKHNNKDVKIILFLYYFMHFLYAFNIGKQYAAVGLVLVAYEYIFSHEPKKFFLCVFLAIGFHPSAIMALPIYYMWDHQKDCLSTKFRTWMIVIGVIILALRFQEFMSIFTEVTEMNRFSVYTATDASGSNGSLYLKLAIAAVELLVLRYLVSFDKRNSLFFILVILDIIISGTGFSSPQFKRCGIYYNITNIYLMASFPYIVEKNQKNAVKIALYVFALFYCFVIFYLLEQGHSMPYRITEVSFEELMNQINQTKLFE